MPLRAVSAATVGLLLVAWALWCSQLLLPGRFSSLWVCAVVQPLRRQVPLDFFPGLVWAKALAPWGAWALAVLGGFVALGLARETKVRLPRAAALAALPLLDVLGLLLLARELGLAERRRTGGRWPVVEAAAGAVLLAWGAYCLVSLVTAGDGTVALGALVLAQTAAAFLLARALTIVAWVDAPEAGVCAEGGSPADPVPAIPTPPAATGTGVHCPECAGHPELAPAPAVGGFECPGCAGHLLPARALGGLLSSLGLSAEVFRQLMAEAGKGLTPCSKCGAVPRVVLLRGAPLALCATCRSAWARQGGLHAMTQGRVGAPRRPPPRASVVRPPEPPAPSLGLRLQAALGAVGCLAVLVWALTHATDVRCAVGVKSTQALGDTSLRGCVTASGLQGAAVTRTCEGVRVARTEYRDGKRHGDHLAWTPDGSVLREKGRFAGDVRQGLWTVWEADGRRTESVYEAGALDGAYAVYAPDGKPLERGLYKDGKKDGRWLAVGPDGKQVEEQWAAGKVVDPAAATAPAAGRGGRLLGDYTLYGGQPYWWWQERLNLLRGRTDPEGTRVLALTRERAVGHGLKVTQGEQGFRVER